MKRTAAVLFLASVSLPDAAGAQTNDAQALQQLGREAITRGDELESAVKLDPSYMPAYFQIGHVAALAGNNFERGQEAIKKYLAYQPKDDEPSLARAHYWLGGIYEKQGQKGEAKSSYAASLKINPNQKDANEAMKRVS